jgi:hypothetical protein
MPEAGTSLAPFEDRTLRIVNAKPRVEFSGYRMRKNLRKGQIADCKSLNLLGIRLVANLQSITAEPDKSGERG